MFKVLAKITRIFHPRGIERFLRLVHDPDKRQNGSIKTVIPYDDGLKINIDTSSFVEWVVFFKGHYEPEIAALIKKYLPRGGVFVDVGANVGVHTLVAAKIAEKVIAAEPFEPIRERLIANIKLNRLENVSVVPLVVSDKEGEVSFYEPEDKSQQGKASLYEKHAGGKEVRLESSTLDRILDGEERVDFIKIDTEGNDGKVIRGGLNSIKKFRPVIVFEMEEASWKMSGVDISTIRTALEDSGYSVSAAHGNERFSTILCVPNKSL